MANAKITADAVAGMAKKVGRPIFAKQTKQLVRYLDHLTKWNRKMNLVGKSDWKTVFETLIVDSLFLADFMDGLDVAENPLCLDFGAGAGLPGIPLRTIWQDGEYWLVEVREKRVLFMQSALGRMDLPGVNVFHGRAEDVLEHLSDEDRQAKADVILSRAFMPWLKLLDLVQPMLQPGGVVVILANEQPPTESELPAGWTLGDVMEYPVKGGKRHFWSLRLKQ